MSVEVKFVGTDLSDVIYQINKFLGAPSEKVSEKPGVKGVGAKEREVLKELEAASKPEPKPVEKVADEPVAEEPAAETQAPDYEAVRSAVLQLSLKRGRSAVVDTLEKFGAKKNAQEIDASRYSEVIEHINKLLED